jgi:SAM-dependent methyltransferase
MNVTASDVRNFWENHPVSAAAIPHKPGTPEFFLEHERLRVAVEPADVQRRFYEWDQYSGRQLLDIGCGTGYVAALYASGGAVVTAVDIAERSAQLTRRRLAWKGLPGTVRVANAEALPFGDDSFDVATSLGVLHHTPDTARALTELHRVLRPGGICHLMFYHRNSFAYRVLFPLKRLFQPAWRGKSAQDQINAVDGMDNPLGKVFTRADLMDLMPGFTDFEFGTWGLFFRHAGRIPKPLRDFLAHRWGWFLYVKARKATPT